LGVWKTGSVRRGGGGGGGGRVRKRSNAAGYEKISRVI